MTFPLTKPCDLAQDADALAATYRIIDRAPDALAGQHPIRRWEYAMAVAAIQSWQLAGYPVHAVPSGMVMLETRPVQICDVGGAGSNFWQVLGGLTSEPIVSVDPQGPPPYVDHPPGLIPYGDPIERFAATHSPYQAYFDILTCISVIEHVVDLLPFFHACHQLLKPGGLLFLTTDYWDQAGADTAHFHWMRRRIYNADRLKYLIWYVQELGFQPFGEAAWDYPGPQVYDYSVASLALTRKDR